MIQQHVRGRLHLTGNQLRPLLAVGLTTLALLAPFTPVTAQNQPPRTGQQQQADTAAARRAIEDRLGRSMSQTEIMERLRQSGMTRAQIRVRLQQAGYDPGLADRYFDAIERGGDPPRGEPSEAFMEAMGRLGLASRLRPDTTAMDSLRLRELEMDSLRPPDPDTLGRREMEVFGLRTFRRAGNLFEPMPYGPVDAGYRLGPGDEILLVLTGDVEDAYTLDVSREGIIFIPAVGQVSVNGLTLAQLEDVLYSRLGRVYSGVSRSPNASTRFSVSVGQLRVNQITVTGDVVRPGSYAVSSVGGLFNALYQAGGPTAEGSFRRVEIWRGGRLHHAADLYDFLVRGDGGSDIRLEHNDRIFVPPAGPQARVEGSVRRPAVYEVKPGESMRDLLAFAGGLRSDALVRRIQVDRILPPAEQRPGVYRTLVDVDLNALVQDDARVRVTDGDVVTVSAVSDLRRNRVWVDGEVRNPGLFEWSPGSTMWSVLERADGLSEQAYTARAHIYRLYETDGTRRLIPVSLERDDAGRPLHDLPLADNDSIVVLNRAQLRTEEFVTIDGWVKNPDTYPLARGMTLRDLILAAEGFSHGAYIVEAEVSRLTNPLRRTDTTAYVIKVPLGDASEGANGDPGTGEDVLPRWLPQANELQLQHGDRVFVRRAPGYEPVREVHVSGEVLVPGGYVLASREERVVDVIRRAGGLTPQAFDGGIRVVRDGHTVAADVRRALRRPDDPNNIILMAGDSLHVPAYDPMVAVTGGVNFEARVLWVRGKDLNYYVNQAGGYTDDADRKRVTVTYANGERSAREDRWVGSSSPRVEPGSQVFVPLKPENARGTNWDTIFTRTAGLLSAVATALIAYSYLK
jgi:polysaccharide biosynthesis/export protein